MYCYVLCNILLRFVSVLLCVSGGGESLVKRNNQKDGPTVQLCKNLGASYGSSAVLTGSDSSVTETDNSINSVTKTDFSRNSVTETDYSINSYNFGYISN